MYKNSIISALAAVLAVRSVPCFAACEPLTRAAVFAGLFVPLLFFCLFCDTCAEKWRNRERDERHLAEYIKKLGRG